MWNGIIELENMECDSAAHLIQAVSRDLARIRDLLALVGAAYVSTEAIR